MAGSRLYVVSTKGKFVEAGSRTVVPRSRRVEKVEAVGQKYKVLLMQDEKVLGI